MVKVVSEKLLVPASEAELDLCFDCMEGHNPDLRLPPRQSWKNSARNHDHREIFVMRGAGVVLVFRASRMSSSDLFWHLAAQPKDLVEGFITSIAYGRLSVNQQGFFAVTRRQPFSRVGADQ